MKSQTKLVVACLCVYLAVVGAYRQEENDSNWEEAKVENVDSGIQPMAAEPQSVDGVIDTLQGLLHQGGRIAEGFEHGMGRGAGGLGQASGRVTEAFHGLTDRFAAIIKAPFSRRSSSRGSSSSEERSSDRLRHESGSASEGMDPESEAEQAPVVRRAPSQQQMARETRRATARDSSRASRVSRHAHGMRKSAFETQGARGSRPVPATGRVRATPPAGHAKGLSYSEAKRIALKAAKPLAAQRGMDRKSMMKVVREAAREAAYLE